MALFWGVTPLPMPELTDRDQLRAFILDWCRARGLIAPGDRIVGIRGSWPDDPTHNEIVVLEVRWIIRRSGSQPSSMIAT